MKAFLWACVAMVALSIGSYYGLGSAGFSAADQTTGPAVRLE